MSKLFLWGQSSNKDMDLVEPMNFCESPLIWGLTQPALKQTFC